MSAAVATQTPSTVNVAPTQFDLFGADIPAVSVVSPPAMPSAPKSEPVNLSAPPVRTEPDSTVLEPAGVELGDGAATRERSLVRLLTKHVAAEMTRRAKNKTGQVFTEADALPWIEALFAVLFVHKWAIWRSYPVCSNCRETIEKARAEVEARLPETEARAARMIAENAEATKRHLAAMENRQ